MERNRETMGGATGGFILQTKHDFTSRGRGPLPFLNMPCLPALAPMYLYTYLSLLLKP